MSYSYSIPFIATLLFFSLFILEHQPTAASEQEETDSEAIAYVGVDKCRMCHIPHYDSWAETKMSRAFDLLKKGVRRSAKHKAEIEDIDYTKEEYCLSCHTTGFGMPGGFVSMEETPHLAGVQCEMCHGPGAIYSKMMLKKKGTYTRADYVEKGGLIMPSKENGVCEDKCHNEASPFVTPDRKFNFADRKAIGTHKHDTKQISMPFDLF